MRKVAPMGSRLVLQARLLNMKKFGAIIVAYSVANPLLYLLAIGAGVGTLINRSSGGIDGVPYLVFLAPALLANAAIQGSMDETVFPTLAGFLWSKTFYGMNATPLGGRDIALGVYWAALVRNIFTVICYYLVMMFFGVLKAPHAWLAIPAGILAGAAFGAVMLAFAGNVTNEDHFFTFVGRFVIQPMFFLSGTFFPLDSIPIYLRWIGWISPLWHATDLGRYLTYGHKIPITLVWVHVLFLVSMIIVGLTIAFRAFSKRLAK
jgi:lipooligosaccharide transport system permease protein